MELKETKRLLTVVRDLRKKCPWDKKQTHRTLLPYLLEEAYETVEAIESRKKRDLREELGDVLLQIALHAEIAAEKGQFSFEDVAKNIADKMIHRHPHIYKKAEVKTLKQHMESWTRLKQKEKPKKGMLDGIPQSMPSLQRAQRYAEIAESVGWNLNGKTSLNSAFEKLENATKQRSPSKKSIEQAFGTLFFTLASLSRESGVDAESALRREVDRFRETFRKKEKRS